MASGETFDPKAAGVVVPEGGLISHQTAGGGGYGDPRERDPDLIRADVLNGYTSPGAAREAYGWEERGGR